MDFTATEIQQIDTFQQNSAPEATLEQAYYLLAIFFLGILAWYLRPE